MGLLTDGMRSLVEKAPNTERLPQVTGAFGGFGNAAASGLGATSIPAALGAMTAVGTLFAIVDRMATSVAAVEWELTRVQPNGDAQVIVSHPLIDLWEKPNPFMTRSAFLETLQQHFDLVGEAWIVIVRAADGRKVELWPVRPDKMAPVKDPKEFISGYVYRNGGDTIPLETRDVIFMKRPNPLDPYRGLGVIQALMTDLGSEVSAAQWSRSFFSNSAQPGGIIEFEEGLTQEQFDDYSKRWRQQHQGVTNAGRVAIIEQGKWRDVAFNMRDMQFEQLRHLNRDLILIAYGVSGAILGVTENVNLANANAAEFIFSTRSLVPRLRRFQLALNSQLIPALLASTGTDLRFRFINPVPEDKTHALNEAKEGFNSRFLTLNEARARVGEGEVPGGDEFKQEATGLLQLSVGSENNREKVLMLPVANDELAGDNIVWTDAMQAEYDGNRKLFDPSTRQLTRESQQREMTAAWAKRLKAEADALIEFMSDLAKGTPATVQRAIGFEANDINGYDWDWFEKYGADVVAELTDAFLIAFEANETIAPGVKQRLASEYAEARGASLLKLDGELSITNATRTRVNSLVSDTITSGDSLQTLQSSLRSDVAFSRTRAERVARTETTTALGQGGKAIAVAEGRNEKRWVTQGDDLVSPDICAPNEAQGFIKVVDPFQSGDDVIPGHVNCRCTIAYRTVEPEERGLSDGRRLVATMRKYDLPLAIKDGKKWRCAKNHSLLVGEIFSEPYEFVAYCKSCKQDYLITS